MAGKNVDEARAQLTDRIKMKALELGYTHVGIIPCHDFDDYAKLVEEDPNYAFFAETEGTFHSGCFPTQFFPQGKSIVCAVFGFGNTKYPDELARYVGRAYLARCYVPKPEIMAGRRITAMTEFLEGEGMDVYTGPIEIPARPACIEAGIVSYGHNNFIYTEEDGSFIIAYAWIVDEILDYDTRDLAENPINQCPPDCHICTEACPTQALKMPYGLNPLRCILMNDLTLPKMNPEVVDKVGTRIHGCDVCQMVCPRNKPIIKSANREDPFLEKLVEKFNLEDILFLNSFEDDYYRDVVYPIMYNYITDVELFRRNAAIAMGNSGNKEYVPALKRAIETFPDSPTADACEWALGKLAS